MGDLGRQRATRLDLFGRLIVLTVLGVTPFAVQRGFFRYFEESQWTFFQLTAALAAVIWITLSLRRPLRRPTVGAVLAVGFLLWSVLSATWANVPRFSLHEANTLAACVALYFLVVVNRTPTPALSPRVLWAVVLVAAHSAVFAHLQFLAQWGRPRETELSIWLAEFLGYGTSVLEGKRNIRALFGHPNFLAGYLAPATGLAAYLLWSRSDLRRGLLFLVPLTALTVLTILLSDQLLTRPSAWLVPLAVAAVGILLWAPGSVRRLAHVLIPLGLISGLIICRSRSCWAALFLIAIVAAAGARKHRRLRRAHGLALALSLVLAVSGVAGLRLHRQRTRSWEEVATLSTATSRMYDFGIAARMFRDRPLLGWGFGTFKVDFFREVIKTQTTEPGAELYEPHLREARGGNPYHVHNDHFEIAVETGLVGLALFVGLLAWTAVRLGEVALRSPATPRSWLALAVGCALLAVLSDAVFSFPLNLPLTAGLFWAMLGLAHRLVADDSPTAGRRVRRSGSD